MTQVVTVPPPISPMLAAATGDTVPTADSVAGGLLFEPKWDGFRCLIFRLEDSVVLQSRSEEDLSYCFPEMVAAAEGLLPGTVLDGELIIVREDRLDFDSLSTRLRPRKEAGGASIAALAQSIPTRFVAFDLLALPGEDLMAAPLSVRRAALVKLGSHLPSAMSVSPATTDHDTALEWFTRFEGAGLDGVIAKPLTGGYRPGKRDLLKVKHKRTADVVIGGWRAHKTPGPDGQAVVGSLLLGLFDEGGRLQHVGSASSFSARRRVELLSELAPASLADESSIEHPWASPTDTVRAPGGPSRWRKDNSAELSLIRPELVAEVSYDQMEGVRFRHVTRFLRWRPDRLAESCNFEQLHRSDPVDVAELLGL